MYLSRGEVLGHMQPIDVYSIGSRETSAYNKSFPTPEIAKIGTCY